MTTIIGNESGEWLTGYQNTDDYIDGRGGNDVVSGLGGHDTLIGGAGDDTLFGYAGNDQLFGEAGNDFLYASEGDDNLDGGLNDDILAGGIGNDTLVGGDGADKFTFYSLSEGIDTIADFKYWDDDKIHIQAFGFGASSTDQFTYDANTGALYFEGTQFASLQPNLDFIPGLDITLF